MKMQQGLVGRAVGVTLLASLLTACGGGSGDDSHADEHDHSHIETAGRLAILEDQSKSVRIYDLDEKSVVGTFTVTNAPSAIYPSPGNRYALLFERTNNLVELIDGGIWQEDHGDHLHDYKEPPKPLDLQIAGIRPTHYEAHDGVAPIFMDGLSDTGQNAAVVTISDESIAAGRHEASLELPVYMHGTAEPRGDYLLTTYRDSDGSATSPQQVELYRRSGEGYMFVERFAELCPSLHGSYSNESHTAFGCLDGVLVVTQTGDDFTARKIANPPGLQADVRIGTIVGHDRLGEFIGIASPGLLFEIDPVAGEIKQIAWAEGRTRRAHQFDAHGENFMVLDDQGTLHVLDATRDWSVKASLPTIASMPGAAPFPSIAASVSSPRAFVSDPSGRQVAVVDLDRSEITERLALDFMPTGLVWLGTPAHQH
jgi:hypothetical protein